MNHLKLRTLFQDFFTSHSHQWMESFPLVPQNDPSLLFVNAGMNPLKNIFLGIESSQHSNLASIQKCVRVGGKHNDLEEVGASHSHHTFFEMMGNFSFGSLSKEQACQLAWEFLTQELKISPKNLGVSVFEKDKETAEIWKKIGVPDKKIFFYGEEDNFWRMGDEGPCGPCSEIYFDAKEFRSKDKDMIEIWNLVFMEYYEDKDKNQKPLKTKCIDTGMGLERILSFVQNESSNFHTDLFRPLLDSLSQLTKVPYQYEEKEEVLTNNTRLRILADHTRVACFLIGDGVYPSNEGRGYVLRRILRRALYEQSQLTAQKQILSQVSKEVIKNYSSVYPELVKNQKLIVDFLNQEEQKFFQTLSQGRVLLEKEIQKSKSLSGETIFKLYDTYGFPFDLVETICRKQNIQIDSQGFFKRMEELKKKTREQKKFSTQKKSYPSLEGLKTSPTKFTGYKTLKDSSKIHFLFDEKNNLVKSLKDQDQGLMILDQTCFYAEGGGQVADQGLFETNKAQGEIQDCQDIQNVFFHTIKLKSGELKVGDLCKLTVYENQRKETALHHSATHLLHSALRKILGDGIHQAGSYVSFDRTRFDFTFSRKLSEDELIKIESLVNEKIFSSLPVDTSLKKYEQALKDGALSFFEKAQGQKVRVLKMGDFSHELCGGTHVQNTSQIRYFKILSESSVGSGIRRIEAICGERALYLLSYLGRENMKARQLLNIPLPESLSEKFSLIDHIEKQKNQIRELKKSKPSKVKNENFKIEPLTLGDKEIGFFCATYKDVSQLSSVSDLVRKKHPMTVVVVAGESEQNNPIVVAFPEVVADKISPREIILKLGGKGGGPKLFAKGAIPHKLSLSELRTQVLSFLQKN